MVRLFEPSPRRWGLRGDPYLWEAMRSDVVSAEMPATAAAMIAMLHREFRRLVGVDVASDEEQVLIPEFAHGGMSSGFVSVAEWRDRLMPMLEGRARKLYAEP